MSSRQVAALPRDERYDAEAVLVAAARMPVATGAEAMPMVGLDEIAAARDAHPDSVLVVSDVHAQVDRLHAMLLAVGEVDDEGRRRREGSRLVQIGDLVDGRDVNDEAALAYGLEVFDEIIVGNHEAAFLGGKTFGGQQVKPALTQALRRACRAGSIRGASEAHGFVLVHGGAHPAHYPQLTAAEVAAAVDEAWERMFWRSDASSSLFDHTAHGGRGGSSVAGGALWCDWEQLAVEHAPVPQICGHSPRGRVERSVDGQAIAIDLAGARLGVACVLPGGRVLVGSDRDQADVDALVTE